MESTKKMCKKSCEAQAEDYKGHSASFKDVQPAPKQ